MTKLRSAIEISLFMIVVGCGSNEPSSGTPSGTGGAGGSGSGGTSASTASGSGGKAGAGGKTGGAGTTTEGAGGSGGSTTAGTSSVGSGGSGGGSGTGGSSGETTQVSCMELIGGCTCSAGKPSTSDVAVCSRSSVAASASDKGRCCKGGFFCTCESYSCVLDTSLNRCFCGTTATLKLTIPSGTKLDACPTPASGNKCCHEPTVHTCDCNHPTCSGSAKEVPACSLTQITTCDSDEKSVDSCK